MSSDHGYSISVHRPLSFSWQKLFEILQHARYHFGAEDRGTKNKQVLVLKELTCWAKCGMLVIHTKEEKQERRIGSVWGMKDQRPP